MYYKVLKLWLCNKTLLFHYETKRNTISIVVCVVPLPNGKIKLNNQISNNCTQFTHNYCYCCSVVEMSLLLFFVVVVVSQYNILYFLNDDTSACEKIVSTRLDDLLECVRPLIIWNIIQLNNIKATYPPNIPTNVHHNTTCTCWFTHTCVKSI